MYLDELTDEANDYYNEELPELDDERVLREDHRVEL